MLFLKWNHIKIPQFCYHALASASATRPQGVVSETVIFFAMLTPGARGGVLVEALRYKPEGHGFDFRWCHWIFSLT
jgi:hypothetical protein